MIDRLRKYWLLNKHLAWLLLIYIATAFFSARFLYNWDSGQFALATRYFALQLHQPHPPGYPLFIFAGQILNFIINDLNLSFVMLNWLAGGVSVWFMWRLLRLIGISERGAFATTFLWIVNPVFWFNHNVALTYTFEGVAVVASCYLIARSLAEKNGDWLLWNAVISGIMIGFRPSMAVVLAINLLVHAGVIWGYRNRRLFMSAFLFGLAALSWFFPFLLLAGARTFWHSLSGQVDSLPATWRHGVAAWFYGASILFGLNLTIIVPLFIKKWSKGFAAARLAFFLPAFVSMLLFYFFGHFGNVAYIISFLPIWFMLISPGIDWFLKRSLRSWVIVAMITVEIFLFFIPAKFFNQKEVGLMNYQTILEHDRRMSRYVVLARQAAIDGDKIVVAVRGQYFNEKREVKSYPYDDIRVLSYYLPQVRLYDLLGVRGVYFLAENSWYTQVNRKPATFPKNTGKMIVLADYLFPDTRPKGLPVTFAYSHEATDNYYEFDISKTDKFNFLGTNFVRGR
jgi:hypothetical protein